jgi:hypothetical protein
MYDFEIRHLRLEFVQNSAGAIDRAIIADNDLPIDLVLGEPLLDVPDRGLDVQNFVKTGKNQGKAERLCRRSAASHRYKYRSLV